MNMVSGSSKINRAFSFGTEVCMFVLVKTVRKSEKLKQLCLTLFVETNINTEW